MPSSTLWDGFIIWISHVMQSWENIILNTRFDTLHNENHLE